jgi:hypothetical protein
MVPSQGYEAKHGTTGWVGLHVIAEQMKIYSYLPLVKNPYLQDISFRPDTFKCLYSRISLNRPPQDWRGAGLLSISSIKQYLY